ncbi:hypothetical protein [Streptomyces sp. CBMA156]|uniref:hypothetical protein n=1 Tax=Streptomyces sp. CBMA156 TaxID=1930280 RepID=UPI001661CE26|nr:hypothetical protein [Streptomyces sp. CBMA156]MBD0671621.1 hypothetical protein [Streptomyces sp. CBMA156]MBD0671631.1 hypothetical protein [Streptomyces sp. CBMA156]
MGIRSFLGLGSSSGSSGEPGSGTSTRTGGMSASGWHSYDEATARRHHREAQAPAAPAGTDRYGRRVVSADPYSRPDSAPRRNFGRPYTEHADDGGAR